MAGPIKSTNRLDHDRLVDALIARGMVHPEALRQIQAECAARGGLLPEALVNEGTVSDWDLSRVVAEVFGLPFLPVDAYEVSKDALKGLDPEYLVRHCLVPLDRFGKLLTVAMPGMVPSDVLAHLGAQVDSQVVPVVGTVQSNRAWLTSNLQTAKSPGAPGAPRPAGAPSAPGAPGAPSPQRAPVSAPAVGTATDGDWLNLFDAADEQVRTGPAIDLDASKKSPAKKPPGASEPRQEAA